MKVKNIVMEGKDAEKVVKQFVFWDYMTQLGKKTSL